ncbi:hypothetical protein PFLA_a3657 [Pseudoalteromonas flavipulchra NCIMB 2033 = ATCC BAA-314]|nr:hypothetical protein [Pseudoalteromonas flavipulchra NCIMB 2033 = ATCC BAA-314]
MYDLLGFIASSKKSGTGVLLSINVRGLLAKFSGTMKDL